MSSAKRSVAPALTAALVLVCTGAFAPARSGSGQSGQQTSAQPPAAAQPANQIVTPGEIQRMFEAVALVRAQEALKLSDDRYIPFIAKYKALQDVRRKAQGERGRILSELRKLSNDPAGDEAQMRDRLKALEDLHARSEGDIRKAQEGVDSVLDVRQQAKFRLFEEAMEVQKVDLITKARQAVQRQRQNP
jgi:hypothetical protein